MRYYFPDLGAYIHAPNLPSHMPYQVRPPYEVYLASDVDAWGGEFLGLAWRDHYDGPWHTQSFGGTDLGDYPTLMRATYVLAEHWAEHG